MLNEAADLVDGERNNQYGEPTQDFQRTATMWGAYLGVDIESHDVAAMMSLLKLSRIRWAPEKRDSWVDLAGYAACGLDCARSNETNSPDIPELTLPFTDVVTNALIDADNAEAAIRRETEHQSDE